MNWRRAIFAAACLVLAAAIAHPPSAWASATTGVTIVAAESEEANASTNASGSDDAGAGRASERPGGPLPATGDIAGIAFVFAFAVALVAAGVIAWQRNRAKERFRMHEIGADAMRSAARQNDERRRRR